MNSPISIDFGFGGDLYILDYPSDSSQRFIYKLTNAATPALIQHTTNFIFNHNRIQFLPLDAGGEQLIINASQNFTQFGGTNDGRLFAAGPTSGQPSVEWSNGTNIPEGVPPGWWDPSSGMGVFRDNWLLVRNGGFKDSLGTTQPGSLWAVKDLNGDGDANDAGEAYVASPNPQPIFGAASFGSDGVGYGVGGGTVNRLQDVNDDGDFWDSTGGAFDAGEVVPFITGTNSFYGVEVAPNGDLYLTAAAGASPNITIFVYRVRRVSPGFPTVTPTPPAISSLCSPSVPASISGSTGAQGVLDPGNTIAADQPDGGLIWPGTAVTANVFLDTGAVVFTDGSNVVVGTATLPGVSGGFPAFADGKLNFSRVKLPPGKTVTISANAATAGAFTAFSGKAPPAVVLSCEDVILETGSVLATGIGVDGAPVFGTTAVVGPGAFPGGGAATNLPAGGFGPRSGSGAAAGVIYPPLGGSRGSERKFHSNVQAGSRLSERRIWRGRFGGGGSAASGDRRDDLRGGVERSCGQFGSARRRRRLGASGWSAGGRLGGD